MTSLEKDIIQNQQEQIQGEKEIKATISFPLRIASIDMGSNAIRFLAGEFENAKQFSILHSARDPVRLGHKVFLGGQLEQKAMDSAVNTLLSFKNKMEELKIEHYRAIATSAVRESANGDTFIERIKKETGINLEVITGSEELRLIYLAVKNRVGLGLKKWVLLDVGGGSVEIAFVDDSGIIWSESHTMGCVRLLEELKDSVDEPGNFRRLLEEYISTLRIPSFTQYQNLGGLIATGGNIEDLARLANAQPNENNISHLPLSDLQSLTTKLSQLSLNQRMKEFGLKEDRADVILPAGMIYEKVAQLVGDNKIIVPYVGTKEGVLYDFVEDLITHNDQKKYQENQAFNSAITLGRKYSFDEAHCVHVARLALSLFDQLKDIHQLDDNDRKILLAGAVLHDIGMFVSYKKHHKHSLYIISQSEIPYYTSREMLLASIVARYHRKREPEPHHELYSTLSESEKNRVSRMSAILRIADALDRDHLQKVRGIKVKIEKPCIYLEIDGVGEFDLEKWALKRKSQMFSKLFQLKIRLINERDEL